MEDKITFYVCPQTGFQISSNIGDVDKVLRDLSPSGKDFWGDLWEYAARNQNEITEALRDHTAVESDDDALWLCVPGKAGMYYRIRKGTNQRYSLDMAINTNLYDSGTRRIIGACVVPKPGENLKNVTKTEEIGHFTILPDAEITNKIGDLIIDFGNTGTVSAFVSSGDLVVTPIEIFNPWDPKECKGELNGRNTIDKLIFHSNQLLFHFDDCCEPAKFHMDSDDGSSPEDYQYVNRLWWLSGERANEIAKNISQNTTYIYSPKKYIRKWDASGNYTNPRIQLHDINGSYDMPIEPDPIIKEVLRSQLGLIISSLVKSFGKHANVVVPEFKRVLLSYPLTWRPQDRDYFKKKIEQVFKESFSNLMTKNNFNVEMLYYNEPYCVVAYLVSKIIEKYGGNAGNWELVRSILGNFDKDSNKTRILVVDIGGGSTDIAMVDVGLSEESHNCRLELKSTKGFNRAGDRISHIISTIIWEHIKKSRDLDFKLCVGNGGPVGDSGDDYRRILRKLQLDIMQLSENVKKTLAIGKDWYWKFPNEQDILSSPSSAEEPLSPIVTQKNKILANIKVLLDSVSLPGMNGNERKDDMFLSNFVISNDILGRCIEEDKSDTGGFYDVFMYLKNLVYSLKNGSECMPDRIILSGRTSKLPCIKSLLNKVFNNAVPSYRIVSLEDFLPVELRQDSYEFIEKMAVALGIHAFRTGKLSEASVDSKTFNQYIGPIMADTNFGYQLTRSSVANWRLLSDYVKPGDPFGEASLTLLVRPGTTVLLGRTFSENVCAEVIGSLSVKAITEDEKSRNSKRKGQWEEGQELYPVTIRFDEEYGSVRIKEDKNSQDDGSIQDLVTYTDNIPGGIEPVDNFCYDGQLDPDGFIRKIAVKMYPYLR